MELLLGRAEAKRKGQKWFTNPNRKVCKKGHPSPAFYVQSGSCVECVKEHAANRNSKAKKAIRKAREDKATHTLPGGCAPKRINHTLKMNDDRRYMACAHYILCGLAAEQGQFGKGLSWECPEECKHNLAKPRARK